MLIKKKKAVQLCVPLQYPKVSTPQGRYREAPNLIIRFLCLTDEKIESPRRKRVI